MKGRSGTGEAVAAGVGASDARGAQRLEFHSLGSRGSLGCLGAWNVCAEVACEVQRD